MTLEALSTDDLKERRKSAASTVLHWINDEIINAPEEHVKVLGDNLSLSLARSRLAQVVNTGEKMTPDVLYSLDNTRLDNLHMAAMQDPASAEGRNIASCHSIIVSKYLTLEHALIDADLIQYTHPTNGSMNRHDRTTHAEYVQGLLKDLSSGTQAQQDVAGEPMMRALNKALDEVQATGEQISVPIVLALGNNANQKHFLAHSPFVRDTSGESAVYFAQQSEAYRSLAEHCRQRGLVHGVESTPARSRG